MIIEPSPARNDGTMPAPRKPLRALIISFYFPPYQTIGAVRVGKLAKFLIERGWEINILSADDTAARGLPLEIPEELVIRTAWIDIDQMFSRRTILSKLGLSKLGLSKLGLSKLGFPAAAEAAPDWDAGFSGWFRRRLHKLFFTMVHWPDRQIGWLPCAVRAGNRLLATWRPDVIFASSPPPTALLVADILARRHAVPWIADFRDPWVDNPYYEYPRWRYSIERAWEKAVVGRSHGIVSVSPLVRDQFNKKFHKPGILAMNGFDPSDYPDLSESPEIISDRLRLVFTGHIYSGYSDPTILFQAIRDMGVEGQQVQVEFYGSGCDTMLPLAEKIGVASSVIINAPVSYRASLKLQMGADVLLSLQWINEKEMSRIAAKVFEYMGAHRPILAIGYARGPVVDLLTSRCAGFVCDNAADIVAHLRNWLAQKRDGGIPPLAAGVTTGLTRAEQFSPVEILAKEIIQAHKEALNRGD
jgi:hypothetical protein